MRHFLLSLGACLLFTSIVAAQGTQADYERSAAIPRRFADKVFRARVEPRWFDNNTKFWYSVDLAEGKREYVVVDPAKATRDVVTEQIEKDHPRPAGQPQRGPGRRGGGGGGGGDRGQRRSADSPDNAWTISVRDGNLFYSQKAGGNTVQLTTDSKTDDGYEQGGVYWSPDSKYFVAMRTKAEQKHTVYMVESSPRDQTQPKLRQQQYLKPGDEIAQTRPALFSMVQKKRIDVNDELFKTPWSISSVRWSSDSSRFTFLYNQRGHQVMRIVAVDTSGAAKAIVNEEARTFVDYTNKVFTQWIGENELIWMSERDGWNHLYLYDAKTGEVKNQITRGEWLVRGVDRVDTEKRIIYFRCQGIWPRQSPYHVHQARINFDGTGMVVITEGDGQHRIENSPDGKYFIDVWQRVDMPAVTELRRTEDGKLILTLEKGDASALVAAGWKAPERFVAKGRDGKTDIHGVIYRPTNFDPAKKYPVIEKIYAGPQGHFVPQNFLATSRDMVLAELGFIVVQIDGMGTNWRSKAFHDVCWKNLADAGFPDRIAWMKSAAEKYPYMDLSRVGVFGGSAGGQNALGAVLFHPEFYKAAAADCGCHDNRMDKIWWNEQWMGVMGDHYAHSSNVTHVKNLKGKLLLTVGELDMNVDPASTMQVVNALIKENKDFEFIIFPGAGHGIGESPYGVRRRMDFFVRSLMGVEPRAK